MAEQKFLDVAGIRRLWKNVVTKISSSVDAERARAQAEEARIEAKIVNSGAGIDIVEGDAIDIITNAEGQKVIGLESHSINDEHIDSISFSKVTLKDGDTLILHGGSANGRTD